MDIECITIDDLLDGETVDVLKMDVEGLEPYAQIGVKETLARNKNSVLFLGLAPYHLNRNVVSTNEYLAHLEKVGLECQLIRAERRCHLPITTELIPEEGFRGYCNIYCAKRAPTE
jgi:hypothetical protein